MKPTIEVKNLTKEFKGFKAVDNVSFKAQAGEVFGLLGPNGAGKTTTIRVIATVLSPTSGTAEVDGYDIVKNPEEVRKNIGVLTTDIGVYDRFTGRENLKYFGELYGLTGESLDKRISELSRLLEMDDFIDRRAGKYSTGMKQKLAIARSVIHDPKVIIFDEPTAGLDVLASQTVLNFMRQAKEQGKCVILSTHRMPDADKLCDRVAIIHQAKILIIDTLANILAKAGKANLEDAFLALVRSSAKELNQESLNQSFKKKIAAESKKSLRINKRLLVRLILAAIIILGVLIYKFIFKK